MRTINHWINNAEVGSTSGNFGPVYNPATGEQQAQVGLASVSEVDAAVAAAQGRLASHHTQHARNCAVVRRRRAHKDVRRRERELRGRLDADAVRVEARLHGLLDRDAAHLWHPYGAAGARQLYAVRGARGVHLDLEGPGGERHRAIDAMASWWSDAAATVLSLIHISEPTRPY